MWLRRAGEALGDGAPGAVTLPTVAERDALAARGFQQWPVGVAIADLSGRMVLANPAFGEMLGYDPAELVGRLVADITHRDDIEENDTERMRALGDGDSRYQLEKRYLARDGDVVWAVLSVSVLAGDDGAPKWLLGVVVDVTQRKRVEDDLRRRALHDPLTGLLSRAAVVERLDRVLARARADERPVSVLFCDVDGLKKANDTFGHEAGDELLVLAARRLQDAVRPLDIVGRWGGDEFVVVADGADAVAADRMTARVRESLDHAPDGRDRLSVSVGSAVARADESAGDAVRRADAAMYDDKRRRRQPGPAAR